MRHDLGASASPSGSRPAGHAASGVDGGSRFDPSRIDLPGADVTFFREPEFNTDLDAAFAELKATIPWKAREISIGGQNVMQPRLTSWHADAGVTYTYSGRTHHAQPWTPTLLSLRRDVELIAAAKFNSVLLNLYPNERGSIGMHSDDEPELGDRPVIASLSLGAEREFRFRPKPGQAGSLTKIGLTHGSVLVMRGDTQRRWMHGIEKSRRPCGERINLTFRLTHAASGIETRRAATTKIDAVHESPTVATSDGDAQPQSGVNRHG